MRQTPAATGATAAETLSAAGVATGETVEVATGTMAASEAETTIEVVRAVATGGMVGLASLGSSVQNLDYYSQVYTVCLVNVSVLAQTC